MIAVKLIKSLGEIRSKYIYSTQSYATWLWLFCRFLNETTIFLFFISTTTQLCKKSYPLSLSVCALLSVSGYESSKYIESFYDLPTEETKLLNKNHYRTQTNIGKSEEETKTNEEQRNESKRLAKACENADKCRKKCYQFRCNVKSRVRQNPEWIPYKAT